MKTPHLLSEVKSLLKATEGMDGGSYHVYKDEYILPVSKKYLNF